MNQQSTRPLTARDNYGVEAIIFGVFLSLFLLIAFTTPLHPLLPTAIATMLYYGTSFWAILRIRPNPLSKTVRWKRLKFFAILLWAAGLFLIPIIGTYPKSNFILGGTVTFGVMFGVTLNKALRAKVFLCSYCGTYRNFFRHNGVYHCETCGNKLPSETIVQSSSRSQLPSSFES